MPIQQASSPWWCYLPQQQHGCGKSACPTPGSLFGGGRARAMCRVLFNLADQPRKIIITKLSNLFNFLPPPIQLTTPTKWSHRDPPACPAHHISPQCSPPMRLPVCGWLLCFGPPIGGQFMPPCILFSLFLHCSIQCPKQWDSVSHALHPLRATSPDSLPPPMPKFGWLLCFYWVSAT